uniref:Uncharacterized protein n=1 Tax=Rhizophora mucronata TaxID=61149 RepID=A0A2P2QM73_RHIMU
MRMSRSNTSKNHISGCKSQGLGDVEPSKMAQTIILSSCNPF